MTWIAVRCLFTILALMVCMGSVGWAQAIDFSKPLARTNPYVAGAGMAAAASKFPCADATHLGDTTAVAVCEDFEGATSCESGSSDENCRVTWVSVQACANTWDYSYTAAPLNGTNSSLGEETGDGAFCMKRTPAFTASDNVYVYAKIKIKTLTLPGNGNYTPIMSIGNATGAGDYCDLFLTDINVGGDIRWSVYTISTRTDGSSTPAAGTLYHVWLEFSKNTAGGCKVYISETSTKPGSAEVTTSTTSEDAQGQTLTIGAEDTATENVAVYYDDIAISTSSAFGNM